MLKRIVMVATLAMIPVLAQAQSASDVAGDVFSKVEQRVIRDYFKDKAGRAVDGGVRAKDRRDERVRDDNEDNGPGDRGKKGASKHKEKEKKGQKGWKHKEKDRGNDREKNHGKEKGFPPGLAKRGELPPGLQRQLEKNGTLPSGLAKRDIPEDLSRRLPEVGAGKERVVVGNDVVLVEKATGVILDILKDVVAGNSGR